MGENKADFIKMVQTFSLVIRIKRQIRNMCAREVSILI